MPSPFRFQTPAGDTARIQGDLIPLGVTHRRELSRFPEFHESRLRDDPVESGDVEPDTAA